MSTGASAKETNSILVVSHVIIVLFSPMAVVGNAVVLMAIWKNSFQRTSFHILLSVLAFTDLCTGMATPLMSIPYLLLHTFGTVSAIGIFIEAYLVSLTILVITLMSIERWLHMTHRSLLTSRRGYITAVISLLVPIPLVTLQVFKGAAGTSDKCYIRRIYAIVLLCHLCCIFQSVPYYSTAPATNSWEPVSSKFWSTSDRLGKV